MTEQEEEDVVVIPVYRRLDAVYIGKDGKVYRTPIVAAVITGEGGPSAFLDIDHTGYIRCVYDRHFVGVEFDGVQKDWSAPEYTTDAGVEHE